jgi:hypothetical protein
MPPSLFCFWFLKLLCWILNVSLSHTLTCSLFVFIIWTNKLCLYFLVSASISFLFKIIIILIKRKLYYDPCILWKYDFWALWFKHFHYQF